MVSAQLSIDDLLGSTFQVLTPRSRVNTFAWCRDNVCTYEGRPYDAGLYPHLSAPDGPFDAFDDPAIRNIWLQFASRLGKTFFGQCCTLKAAKNDPCPMMFATQSEKLATEVIERTYKMLGHCYPLNDVLKPEGKRRQDHIDLGPARVFVAWARSVATLADKAVKVGHANEIDKWEYLSTSKEGDPLKLFMERFKEYPTRKLILESTPTIKHKSRIERGFNASDRRYFYVPCPHCGGFQRIVLGVEDAKSPGLKWERNGDRSDPDTARATAWYRCEFCPEPILDHHRGRMMRAGRWKREGCEIDRDGKVTGQPIRRGQDAGFQLGSQYSLLISHGDYAAEFLRSKDRPAELRNFVNGWLGETFDPYRKQSKPEEVGERLRGTCKRGVVPRGGVYLTVGVDKQRADGGYLVFVVLAHGADDRTWLVDYGTLKDLPSLQTDLLGRCFPHEDGRWPIKPEFTLVDSGDDTERVYQFVASIEKGILPCKGRDSQGGDEAFTVATLGEHGEKGLREAGKKHIGQVVIHVNTDYTEEALQAFLEYGVPGEPKSLTLCEEASYDLDFLEQLCNGVKGEKMNKRNVIRSLWMKKDENQPNDYRDAMRYGRTAKYVFLAGHSGVEPKREAPPAPVVIQQDQRRGRMNLQRR